ncbi:MAG TPA: acetoacetyl-CoA reductase [Aliidongia sp.]|nr:acetoacetyl-CoA reductase [Aliidongia sp.]
MSRIALVTGGTRGIGHALSLALKAAGYRVVATYVGHEEAARALSCTMGIHVERFDVGDFAACADAVKGVERSVGPIDVLVNNAGITRDAMLHKMTEAHWHEVITTNLTSCFNMCHAVIGGMRARGFGRIVNVASVNGQAGQFGQTNYAAAKAGIIGFTKALALENAAKGITVNAIAPGYVATDMVKAVPEDVLAKIIEHIPVGRLADPEEVARAVLFLVADETRFMTGATLSINGGQYMV